MKSVARSWFRQLFDARIMRSSERIRERRRHLARAVSEASIDESNAQNRWRSEARAPALGSRNSFDISGKKN
jgi:hypothetical protein